MLKIFFAFIFLSPLLASAQDEPGEYLEWTSRKLSWNDYKAKAPEQTDAAAITSTAIAFEYHVRSNKLSYNISCRFSRTRSWGKYRTEYILGHEQGHFDITELYARKLSKELSEYEFNPRSYRKDLNKIYESVMREKEDLQNQYDEETDYSRKKGRQNEWLARIADMLDEYADYAEYNKNLSPGH
jgi:predicted secreted Zn-dependent protease